MTSLGRRWPTAIAIASSTSSARRWFAIAQPTILRLQASSTTTSSEFSVWASFSHILGGAGEFAEDAGLSGGGYSQPPMRRNQRLHRLAPSRPLGDNWMPSIVGTWKLLHATARV